MPFPASGADALRTARTKPRLEWGFFSFLFSVVRMAFGSRMDKISRMFRMKRKQDLQDYQDVQDKRNGDTVLS